MVALHLLQGCCLADATCKEQATKRGAVKVCFSQNEHAPLYGSFRAIVMVDIGLNEKMSHKERAVGILRASTV